VVVLLFAILLAGCRERRVVAHFYYVNEPSSWNSLQGHAEHIGLLSPQWLSVDKGIGLESAVDGALVDWAHDQAIPLMPLLVNRDFDPEVAHAFLNDSKLQAEVVAGVVQAVLAHQFYGIQVDFEHVPREDRKQFTQFVRRVSEALRRHGKKLSVAVPSPLGHSSAISDASRGRKGKWHVNGDSRAYNYRALARMSDFISLMAYDQHFSGKIPGPVAGFPWVEASVRETLRFVPRKKLFLGQAFYYRHWAGTAVEEGSHAEAVELARQKQTKIELNPREREKTFTFEEGGARHEVWLSDAETLRERLRLVERYQLGGFSVWRLGQEDPAAWRELSGFLSNAQRAGSDD
jgi:spore germination protein YaaH